MTYDLNDQNFLIYAMKAYDRPNCIMSEFDSDMKRVKYVKRLLNKFVQTGDLKERLILNHIIILSNVFGTEFMCKMLFFKLDREHYPALKTFLVYLNLMPKYISTVDGKTIISADIEMEIEIVKRLREI